MEHVILKDLGVFDFVSEIGEMPVQVWDYGKESKTDSELLYNYQSIEFEY